MNTLNNFATFDLISPEMTVEEKLEHTERRLETRGALFAAFPSPNTNSVANLRFKAELVAKYDVTPYGDALFVVRKHKTDGESTPKKRAHSAEK